MTPQKVEYMVLTKYVFHPYKLVMMEGLDIEGGLNVCLHFIQIVCLTCMNDLE